MKYFLTNVVTVLTLFFIATPADAVLFSRLGGQAYYDDVLDVTWVADANLAASNTFGLSYDTDLGDHPDDTFGPGYTEMISSDGSMNWGAGLHWIDAMNASNGGAGYLGYNDWRLPMMIDNGCTLDTYSGDTCGYNVLTGSAATTVYSELASLWYDTLGNLARYDEAGTSQPGWGLSNPGPFSNIQDVGTDYYGPLYWFGLEFALDDAAAWFFNVHSGHQQLTDKSDFVYSWAVRAGDVSTVPVPAAAWLFGSGLLGLAGIARRRS